MEHRMHILFPTAMLMAQAGLIAGMTASLAWPAIAMGMAQAMAAPPVR
jgi:hypothetical protein